MAASTDSPQGQYATFSHMNAAARKKCVGSTDTAGNTALLV